MRVYPDGGGTVRLRTQPAPWRQSGDVTGYRQGTGIVKPPADAMTVDVLTLRLSRAREVTGPGQDVPPAPPVRKKLMLPGSDVLMVRLPPKAAPFRRRVEPAATLLSILTRMLLT